MQLGLLYSPLPSVRLSENGTRQCILAILLAKTYSASPCRLRIEIRRKAEAKKFFFLMYRQRPSNRQGMSILYQQQKLQQQRHDGNSRKSVVEFRCPFLCSHFRFALPRLVLLPCAKPCCNLIETVSHCVSTRVKFAESMRDSFVCVP